MKVSSVLIIIVYFLCCLLIYLTNSVLVLMFCIIVFGILDQSIWILTTYMISFLYPVKTNFLISACFTGISFSIFIWANFGTQYINKENNSLAFIFDTNFEHFEEADYICQRLKEFIFYQGLIFLSTTIIVTFMFNINEKSKINLRGYFSKIFRGRWCNWMREESKDAKKFKMFLSRSLKHKYYVSRKLIREVLDLPAASERPINEAILRRQEERKAQRRGREQRGVFLRGKAQRRPNRSDNRKRG